MKLKRILKFAIPGSLALGAAVFLLASGNVGSGNNAQAESNTSSLESNLPAHPVGDQFSDYWYQGKGELNSFDLEQARYGQVHKGEAVLVFVTEDFSTRELTKASMGEQGVPVLKVNFDKKFLTGIYPYSMLMSVATPVDLKQNPYSLKLSTSSQEWCGHTYTQLNLDGNKYQFTEHSYFPGEGDQEGSFNATLLEDELWTRLRLNPENLPTGELTLFPSSFYARLKHKNFRPVKATASLRDAEKAPNMKEYILEYKDGSRSLTIRFESNFPYLIDGWEESYVSGWGAGASKLTTTATRKKTILLDYWNRNGNRDRQLRKALDLNEQGMF